MTEALALAQAHIDSPVGELTLVATPEHLMVVTWGGLAARSQRMKSLIEQAKNSSATDHPVLMICVRQLEEYFAGDRQGFNLPLRAEGTDFQMAAWEVLRKIPFGQTMSYAQQAERAKSPRGFRAVGSANGRNPISIVIPCHRVIGADGSLTGFGGGIDAKSWLLDHEQRVLGR